MALLKIVSGEKPREIAVGVLGRRSDKEFTEDLLERELAAAQLPGADRRLCQELVYGITRWQATLDWLIARKTANRQQKPALQNLLRLGLYQIFWLERIPNHAAVHVTVELAKHRGFGPQAGFVNALLRGCLREFEATRSALNDLKTNQPALGYSHPEWLVARWDSAWGSARTAQLLAWNNTPPKTYARINTLKIHTAKLLTIWRDEGVEYDFVRHDWFEENLVFELKSHPPLDKLKSFQNGFFYIQDPSTLLAVHELQPQPGETILDLCAAPGGKLSYIALAMGNQGRIIAHDTDPSRMKLVDQNCARLGITCVEKFIQQAPPEIADPNAPRSSAQAHVTKRKSGGDALPRRFDRILLDAPCSNTGVMRRRVDLRWRISLPEIERLKQVQLGLFRRAVPLLKPGGTLAYSTCSFEPEENRQVVEAILREEPQLKLVRDRELLPFNDSVDGAYVAKLVRT